MQNFIDGKYVPAENYLDSYDPSTGDVWAKIPDSDESEVETAVEAASKAFERYVYICMSGACLMAKTKYAGGGYGRGWLLLQFLNGNTDLIVSKTKVKNSQNLIALVQDYYKIGILVMLRPNPGGKACFYCIFRDFRRFYFLEIQKLKYAAAYFAYAQARPCMFMCQRTFIRYQD